MPRDAIITKVMVIVVNMILKMCGKRTSSRGTPPEQDVT